SHRAACVATVWGDGINYTSRQQSDGRPAGTDRAPEGLRGFGWDKAFGPFRCERTKNQHTHRLPTSFLASNPLPEGHATATAPAKGRKTPSTTTRPGCCSSRIAVFSGSRIES